ncbi:thioredoxin-like [Lycorma delicatula]|uniref:thioredoxin-like n=1 Tax=Lycorma delicatula TaxID=130591 RepID=UPI003F50E0B8
MSLIRLINDENHFQGELQSSGTKLVVVDFTASWCGPCQRIAPFFEELSRKYPKAVFLKVDVDKCGETAALQGVSAMPTFIFYRNKTRVDKIQGADPTSLESKIKQHYTAEDGEDVDSSLQGHMDLTPFFMEGQCEALNESDEHPLKHCLSSSEGFLESDCDEQLIMSLTFKQKIKLHSVKIKAPKDKGPKNIKFFINQPHTLDFDSALISKPVQEIELTPEDLEGNPINLRFVKFQNVHNLQLFIQDNQGGADTTQIDYLQFIGLPIPTTDMSEFKRVTGKKGEGH